MRKEQRKDMRTKALKLFILILIIFASLFIMSQAVFCEENLPGEFEKVYEGINLSLYAYHKEGNIAVKENKTGYIWWSNPPDRDSDKIAKGIRKMSLNSQILVSYVDSKNLSHFTTSKSSVIAKGGLNYEKIENGIKFVYNFTKEGFVIPVQYTIHEDHFKVKILTSDIIEKNENKIVSIEVLPFFGSAGVDCEGYIFIPDGSGAIINLNNGKKSFEHYEERIYGWDHALDRPMMDVFKEEVKLPVFGMKRDNNGFLAVIASNEAKGYIKAEVAGRNTSYNTVYVKFEYRTIENLRLMERNYHSRDVRMVEINVDKETPFEIRYYFLHNKKANYIGMAETYREYLIKQKGLSKSYAISNMEEIPLYIELYGSVRKKKSILGLPIEINVPLTTFEQAQDILEELKNMGISNIVVRYLGWSKQGLFGHVPLKPVPMKALGGKKGFNNLIKYAQDNNIIIYPDVDFVNIYKTGKGYSKLRDTVKSISALPIRKYQYRINFYDKDFSIKPSYLISPVRILDKIKDFNKEYIRLNNSGISMNSIGKMVYSDFSRKNGISRGKSLAYWVETLNYVKQNIGPVLLEQPCEFAVPYSDCIINAPVYSSKFDIADAEIPFYQIVFYGLVPYSSTSINISSNPEVMILKCLETGSYPLYSFIGQDPSAVINTRLNYLYSSDFRYWKEFLKGEYREINNVLSKVIGERIIDHIIHQKGVVETVYENRLRILINYTDKVVQINGKSIAAKSYIIVGEGE